MENLLPDDRERAGGSGARPAGAAAPGGRTGGAVPRSAGTRMPPWDLVTVPLRRGLEAVDILRLRRACGAVLYGGGDDTLGFLVPPGTVRQWRMPGSACVRGSAPGGWPAAAPPGPATGAAACWIVPPCGGVVLTDPVLLRAALGEAERTLAACAATPEEGARTG